MSSSHSQDPALFRIERKQLLEQRKAEKKKLSALQEVRTAELVIGTHSSSGLMLDDPVAAARHCSIVRQAGQFFLKDLDNASGTFLNGIRVQELAPLADGDRIALGVTILELALDAEHPETLLVEVHEGAFFHTIKRRGEFSSDADEWVRSEVKFGQMPRLRQLNALAILVAIAAVWWLSTQPKGLDALQPGALASAHAPFFSSTPPSDLRLANMVKLAQEQACNACHDSFGQPSSEKCASCHEELVVSAESKMAHPFKTGGNSLACIDCHQEHYGSQPPVGTLFPADITERCTECHGDDMDSAEGISTALALAIQEERVNLAPTSDAIFPRVASLGYESFDHQAHSSIENCSSCHEKLEPGNGMDFAPITFEGCANCHSEDAAVTGSLLPPADKRWSVNWHGAGEGGENCTQCHLEAFQPDLRSLDQLAPVPLAFDLGLRSHDDVFHLEIGQEACITCHKTGSAAEPGKLLAGRPFEHDIHLSALLPGPNVSQEVLNQQCAECHTDIAASQGLVPAPDAFAGPPLTACASCHHEADGSALITSAGKPIATTAARKISTRPDFPHDRHSTVEGGCMACHEFGSVPGDNLGFSMASTPEDVASCVRCHMQRPEGTNQAHQNIGGGQCAACHKPQDGITLAAVFRGPQTEQSAPSYFPHLLEAHEQAATCTECHGDPKLGDVHSLSESASNCRECHAANRFHWR